MKIAIVHLGGPSQLIPATSVLQGIDKYPVDTEITWAFSSEELCEVLKYNKKVKRTVAFSEFVSESEQYDLFINLYPFYPQDLIPNFQYRKATGFGFDSSFDELREAFIGTKSFPDMNIFQLYFNLCGLTWKGEGYDLNYYPKSRSKKKRVGVSVANANLRNYVLENLDLQGMKIWYVPYKKNLFKKMDEINKCEKIITDDFTTLHLALYLRKYVYFLETVPLMLKMEMFNSGEVYKVPTSVFL